jgi:hypothetical protein
MAVAPPPGRSTVPSLTTAEDRLVVHPSRRNDDMYRKVSWLAG